MAFRIASLFCLWVFVARRRSDGFGHVLAQQRSDQYDLLVMEDALGNETNSTDAPTDANSTAAPTLTDGRQEEETGKKNTDQPAGESRTTTTTTHKRQ